MSDEKTTILIVDDEPSTLMLLVDTLGHIGHNIEVAQNGESALVQTQRLKPDLILLDIMMPGIDGFETLRRLKADEQTANIPVIFMTALSEMMGEVKGLELGAVDYITKPFHVKTVLARVNTHLTLAHLQKELIEKNEQLQGQNRQLSTLYKVSQIITAPLQLGEVLDNIALCAASLLAIDAGIIWLFDPTRTYLEIRAAYGFSQSAIKGAVYKVGEGLAGRVVQTGQPVIINDLPGDSRFYNPSAQLDDLQACASVPLITKNKIIGAIGVYSKRQRSAFNEQDLHMLQLLASQAAIAIENARLFEQEKEQRALAEHRNQELDTFSYTVAHNLKNTLSGVVSFSEYIQDYATQINPDEISELAVKINRFGQKGISVVNDLLLLAGVRKRRVTLEPVDMANIVRKAQERLTLVAEEHQAEYIQPSDWPVAVGYAPWLEEVWLNYLSNGIYYGGRPPKLTLGATSQPDNMICFWVKDNGPGIGLADQTKLFTEFSRLGNVERQGTGLGLAIVRRVVEKLGGQAGVESQPGQGCTFYFTLTEWKKKDPAR